MSLKVPHVNDFKVYINGIFVRARSVTVDTIQGSAPVATINIDSDYRSQLIGQNDCCPVHVFIYDNYARQSPHEHVLFFDGFITAINRNVMVKAVDVVLTCAHVSSLLDMVDMNFASIPSDDYNTANINVEANAIPYTDQSSGLPTLLMKNFFGDNPIEAPYQLLINALNWLMVDVQFEDGFPTWKSRSEGTKWDSPLKAWYTQTAKQLKFNKRYSKVPYYDTKLPAGAEAFPVMSELAKSNFLKNLILNLANDKAELGVKIGDYMQRFLSMVEFEFVKQAAPSVSPTTGNINTFTVKPMMYGAIPPKCNVIFSSMILNASYGNDVLSKPTRIKLLNEQNALMIGGIENMNDVTKKLNDAFLNAYYPFAPTKSDITIKGAGDDGGQKIQENAPKTINNYEFMLQQLTDEEKRRGLHAMHVPDSMFASFRRALNTDNKETAINELVKRIAHHYYVIYRYQRQNASVNMLFNPYISVGYPTVIVGSPSDGNVCIGLINSISHTITPDRASTSIGLSFVRELSEELQDPMRNGIKADITTQTDILKVDEIYKEILGCGGLKYSRMKSSGSSTPTNPTSVVATMMGASDTDKAAAKTANNKLELPNSMKDQVAAMNSVIANVNPKFDFKTKGLKDAVDEYFLARKKLDGITGDIKDTFKDGNLFQDGNIPAYLDREWLVYNGANEELQLAYDFNYRSICTMKHFMNGEFGIDKPTDKDLTVVDILHRLPLQLKGKIFDIRANDAIYQFILAKIKTVKDDVIFNI